MKGMTDVHFSRHRGSAVAREQERKHNFQVLETRLRENLIVEACQRFGLVTRGVKRYLMNALTPGSWPSSTPVFTATCIA